MQKKEDYVLEKELIDKISSMSTYSTDESFITSGTSSKSLKSKNKELSSANNNSVSPTPSKRRKKKNKGSNNVLMEVAAEYGRQSARNKMLKDLKMVERQQLTNLLDVGFGANWKQIAISCGISHSEIKAIENVVHARGTSPTEALFQLIFTRIPKLTLQELREKCQKIARRDVVDVLSTLM